MPLEADKPYTTLALSEVVAFDPQVIVSCGRETDRPAKPRCPTCKKEKSLCLRVVQDIATREGWKETTAARTGRILAMPCHLLCRPGPRVVRGIERMVTFFQGGTP